MSFQYEIFILLIAIGLLFRKKIDWRGQFFLSLLMIAWIFWNLKHPKP